MAALKPRKTCLIIAGGEFAPLPEDVPAFDFVIACDHGFEYADALGHTPDLIIGDFDSAASEPDPSVPVRRLPVMKDDTDTMSAVKYALENGFTDLSVCCAFGGRFDHSLANVQTAAYIANRDACCRLLGKDTELITVRNGELKLKKRPHSYLSVFAVGGTASGVSLSGTEYELRDALLTPDFPLGVSNEWAGPEAVISVREGLLAAVICTKD